MITGPDAGTGSCTTTALRSAHPAAVKALNIPISKFLFIVNFTSIVAPCLKLAQAGKFATFPL
jgi:hypothetical protein